MDHGPLHPQALALTAVACGLAATGFGLWFKQDSTVIQSSSANGSTYHDTCDVVMGGTFLRNLGLLYFAIAAGLALIARLGPTLTRRLTQPAFAAFHIGASITMLLILVSPRAMVQRYVDYPDWFQTMNQLSTVGAVLCFLALAALIALLLVSLLHSLRRSSN